MKTIVHGVFLTALVVATQSAWPLARSAQRSAPEPQDVSLYSTQSGAIDVLRPLGPYADQCDDGEPQIADVFPVYIAAL